jgi:hypothetical protein
LAPRSLRVQKLRYIIEITLTRSRNGRIRAERRFGPVDQYNDRAAVRNSMENRKGPAGAPNQDAGCLSIPVHYRHKIRWEWISIMQLPEL